MTEFSVRLANRPGQLASLTRLLADAGVEVEALATVADDGHSHLRFIVTDAPRARRVLMNAGVQFTEGRVIDLFLPRGSNALAHMVERLAASEVNIESLYLLHTNSEGDHIALTVDDADTALAAIGS